PFCTWLHAALLRGSSASQADKSSQLSRSLSARRMRQAAACVRRDVSQSFMAISLRQMDHRLDDVLLHGALPDSIQGGDVLLLHILEPEQDENVARELAQLSQGAQYVRERVLTE